MNFVIGIIGLGIVVVVHELGHYLAARIVGIRVKAFSIGWGPVLFSRKWGDTDYRISLIPIGGYCQFFGEHQMETAIKNNLKEFEKEEGAFYSASPLKRIITSLTGPLFNLLLAFLIFWVIWGIGFTEQSYPPRIVLFSEFSSGVHPADQAGLQTGDLLLEIDGQKISHYSDLRSIVAPEGGNQLQLLVERDHEMLSLNVTPEVDSESGTAKIGVLPWIDPVIGRVDSESSAWIAGLKEGDRIFSIDNHPIEHGQEISLYLQNEQPTSMTWDIERDGENIKTNFILQYGENGNPLPGFQFQTVSYPSPQYGFFPSAQQALKQCMDVILMSFEGMASLFNGADLRNAVGGPIRITYLIGEASSQGFAQGSGQGFNTFFNLTAIISIALFIMNLIPIPVLDGGQIVLFIIEAITRKPVSPKTVLRFQTIGFVFIVALLLFSTVNDILFLFSGME